MVNPALTLGSRKRLFFIPWIVLTFSQVLYKLADRPGEMASALPITLAVLIAMGVTYLWIERWSTKH